MLILSKYKDYYDYLSGIYGVDPKIVLDRRIFDNVTSVGIYENELTKFQLYICGMIYEGLYSKGKFYYGEDLLQFKIDTSKRRHWDFYHLPREIRDQVIMYSESSFRRKGLYISLVPYPDKEKENQRYSCPIMYKHYNSFSTYPILSFFQIQSFLPAQEIYLKLSEWLAPKDTASMNRTDKEKIVSAGFDLQTSFRGK